MKIDKTRSIRQYVIVSGWVLIPSIHPRYEYCMYCTLRCPLDPFLFCLFHLLPRPSQPLSRDEIKEKKKRKKKKGKEKKERKGRKGRR